MLAILDNWPGYNRYNFGEGYPRTIWTQSGFLPFIGSWKYYPDMYLILYCMTCFIVLYLIYVIHYESLCWLLQNVPTLNKTFWFDVIMIIYVVDGAKENLKKWNINNKIVYI
jgi:hypothetical protein